MILHICITSYTKVTKLFFFGVIQPCSLLFPPAEYASFTFYLLVNTPCSVGTFLPHRTESQHTLLSFLPRNLFCLKLIGRKQNRLTVTFFLQSICLIVQCLHIKEKILEKGKVEERQGLIRIIHDYKYSCLQKANKGSIRNRKRTRK